MTVPRYECAVGVAIAASGKFPNAGSARKLTIDEHERIRRHRLRGASGQEGRLRRLIQARHRTGVASAYSSLMAAELRYSV
jgi:hypothetical protein